MIAWSETSNPVDYACGCPMCGCTCGSICSNDSTAYGMTSFAHHERKELPSAKDIKAIFMKWLNGLYPVQFNQIFQVRDYILPRRRYIRQRTLLAFSGHLPKRHRKRFKNR